MIAGAGSLAPTVSVDGFPLRGVHVSRRGNDDVVGVAVELLRALGATVDAEAPGDVAARSADVIVTSAAPHAERRGAEHAAPVARLTGVAPDPMAGLPIHTVPYACGLALAGAAVLAVLAGSDVEIDGREVALQVLLPEVLAAEYQAHHRAPAPPRVLAGGGALACDLASADDEAALQRVLDLLGPSATAEAIADEAQAWRLPVCAYRARSGPPRPFVLPEPTAAAARPPVPATTTTTTTTTMTTTTTTTASTAPLVGISVCDLTAMWAGPLATWLLAESGATVHKVEARVRHDGMRGLDGAGIHPAGIDPSTGTTSAMFNALNRRKSCHDLDLREPTDRGTFIELVRSSDLVIDSFSRRVMPNLGFAPDELRELAPGIGTLSIPAFPVDHPWQVALGPGVHAASGLGDQGGGRFAHPVVAYPDPLAGFTAFTVAISILLGRRRGSNTGHAEITLLDAIAPLALVSPPGPHLKQRDRCVGARFLDDDALLGVGAWEQIDDGAGRHRYPRSPFRGHWRLPAPTPAPAIGGAA